ncbi:MAG TPA: hypothetical protein PKG95_02775 [Anaerolineaceae bacterium]|nr:hypothetical protein [Anaerolineaceae bacterium]
MKHIRIPILLVSLLITFSLLTSAAWAATPPQDDGPSGPARPTGQTFTGTAPARVAGGGGIQSLAGSTVVFAPGAGGATCYEPGTAQTFCFQSDSYTADWEYVYNNWLKFPSSWVVSNAYVVGTPTCANGGIWGTFNWSFQTASYEVNLAHQRSQASTDHCVATYCVDVTPAAGGMDVPVSWFFDGDGYGGAPHWPCSNDGYAPTGSGLTCDEAVNPAAIIPPCTYIPQVILTPEEVVTEGCSGATQTHTFTLENQVGYDDTFYLYYEWDFPGALTAPASITLPNGGATTFDVTIEPRACMEPGEYHVNITASDFTYADTATITKELYGPDGWSQIATNPVNAMDNVLAAYDGLVWSITGYGSTGVSTYDPVAKTWATIADSAPPFTNYARSGCQIGSKVYIYGDASGSYTGLWSYAMDTNTWLQETPGGTPPSENAIWAPSWVADEANGLCYLTGGATTPGGGDLAKVYVYDAVANAWLAPLPDFTSVRDFHAAYLFTRPADSHPLLCVAGGVNAANAFLDSTQCYDFTTAAWEAENATLGATPFAWWGMGYTQRTVNAGELWLVAGADGTGSLTNQTWYYSVTDSTWYDYGPLESGAFYRTAAVTLDDMVYHVGGSIGSFSPSGLSDIFVRDCPACTEPALQFSPDHFELVTKTDTLSTQWASLCNIGAEPLEYTFDDAGTTWLIEEPLNGTVAPGECTFPVITFDTTGLSAGGYVANLNVSSNDPYNPLLVLPVQMTVLDSADLVVAPEFIETSVLMGEEIDEVLNIANTGNAPMHYRLLEYNQPFKGTQSTGQGEWLYRAETGVLMDSNSGPQLAYPAAYRWTPATPPKGGGMSILVYADDYYHAAPSTMVDQALRYLGVPYTAFYNGDFPGFQAALENDGPWDLVLVSHENFTSPGNDFLTALNDYVTAGGNLIISSWQMSSYASHPLWTTLGVTWAADDNDPPDPVYWWLPDHPNFNYFDPLPELTSLTGGRYGTYGQHVEPLGGFVALAGYTGTPTTNEAALVTRGSDGGTIFKAFADGQNDADLDLDGMPDNAELWSNLIRGIPDWTYPDIPWLSAAPVDGALAPGENVDVTLHFDGDGLMPGTHTASLVLFNTAIGESPRIIPLYFEVVNLPELVKTAPAEVLPGEQFTYTLTMDPIGFNDMVITDPLPAGVSYVPGSLLVNPDIGAYGYDSGNNSIYWDSAPLKSGLNDWKPAAVQGIGGTVPPQLHTSAAVPLVTPRPAANPKAVLWDQPLSTVNQNAYVNQEFTDNPTYSAYLADDFVADSAWAVGTIFVPGGGWNGFTTLANASALNFLIYTDEGGVPAGDPSGAGAPPIWAMSVAPTDPQVVISTGSSGLESNVTLTVPSFVILPPGHYWLVFYPSLAFAGGGQYGRQPADTTNGLTGQFINPGGGFGYGTAWQNWSVVGVTQADIAFRLEGIVLTPLTITFDVTAEAEDTPVTNTAYLDVSRFEVEASATTMILPSPIKYIFLPVVVK